MGQLSMAKKSPIVTIIVIVATYIIQIPVPATNGYINIGDAMIFTSSLAFGPLVGGVAGGLGSSLSDMWGGYWQFAPITLIVKGLEGLVAGLISNVRDIHRDLLGVLISGSIMFFGYFVAETYLLGYGAAAALVELPGNLFQVAADGIIGVPAAFAVRRYTRSLH